MYFVEIYQDIVREASTDDMRDSVQNLYNLFKDDKVLCDAEMNLFSLNHELQCTALKETPFELCSDRMARLYPTYKLTDDGIF